jgi:hypothetical protein
VLWLLIAFLAIFAAWAATSQSPEAQSVQRVFNRSHTEAIVPASFSVRAHSFSYYKIVVPPGATDVTISGDFSVSDGPDNTVEVYLLTDVAFIEWQNGYSTGNYYESGRVTRAEINAKLPPHPGTYYRVFGNNFSRRTPKAVQASIVLGYKRWWPLW